MQTKSALILGKSIEFVIKKFKLGGGTAAPGLYALKVDPELITNLINQIPKNVIITGTNGKTTTARMLAHLAKHANVKVIRNHTGSNLERGIASTLISASHLTGSLTNFDLGIWELDEAAFNTVAPKIKPDIVVFLNVFRDQLDRYGEIDSVVKRWCETLKKLSPSTVILINGDDSNTAKLKQCFKGKTQSFGVKDLKIAGESSERKKNSQKLDFEARDVRLDGLKGSRFNLLLDGKVLNLNLPLPGLYHIYDTLAALTCASNVFSATSVRRYSEALKTFQPAFGRVEKLPFGYIFLIKNPAGATQVFETIAPQLGKNDKLLMALNDNLADGTDVSWIWDANFEVLQNSSRTQSRNHTIFVSGTRAYDLAVRLKYAGFTAKRLSIEPDLGKALKQARRGLKGLPADRQGRLFILPTYTAMLELQMILTKTGIKKRYWEENELG